MLKSGALIPIVTVSGILIFMFRGLIGDMDSSLLDGIDYPLYAWILQSGVGNLRGIFNAGVFFGNAFYPATQSLLFSDTFYPLSLLLFPLSFFSVTPIHLVNAGLLLTLFLNVVSAAIFTRQFSSNRWSHTFLTLLFSVSPYLFTQLPHLQMLSFWPIYSVLILLQKPSGRKSFIMIALLLSLQWYLSVYLGTMALALLTLWWGIEFLTDHHRKELLKNTLVFSVVFLVCTGPLLFAYRTIQNTYQATPDAGMYVDYAAQPTDYLFSRGYPTVASSIPSFVDWNARNHRGAGEPARWIGFSLLALVVIGFFVWRKRLTLKATKLGWVALGLTSVGFIFSLGTRLTLNGIYTGFPLPYLIVLKLFPFLSFFRSPSRWYFLFVLGCVVFASLAIQYLSKSTKHRKWIVVFSFFYVLETIPLSIPVTPIAKPNYVEWLNTACKPDDVLLSLPVFSYHDSALVALNPAVTSQLMMWTVTSPCRLMNGYSGILPSSLKSLDLETRNAQPTDLVSRLRDNDVTLVLHEQATPATFASFSTVPDVQLLHQDQTYSLWRLYPNQKK